MKSGIKLVVGVVFAAFVAMAVSRKVAPVASLMGNTDNQSAPCYSEKEIQLVMKANGWSEQETKTILDLACKYSKEKK